MPSTAKRVEDRTRTPDRSTEGSGLARGGACVGGTAAADVAGVQLRGGFARACAGFATSQGLGRSEGGTRG